MELKPGSEARGNMLRVLFSLGYADLRESLVGVGAIVKTLGLAGGLKALGFATSRQMSDIGRGEGNYPEKGKRRIWFKLNYLKHVYQYLKKHNEADASEHIASILLGPSLKFIANFVPPPEKLTKDIVLHEVWPNLVENDYNVDAEACPPKRNSATLHVHRCFFNEVVRDIGLMDVADRICHADFVFWENYHPNITFSRTKTLIAGDNLCDHTINWTD
jgi:hypothetical protein